MRYFTIEYRYDDWSVNRLADAAAELVRLERSQVRVAALLDLDRFQSSSSNY